MHKFFRVLDKYGKNEFQVMFQNLGEQWSITEELCVQLESFVCAMYGMKKGDQDVNQCRYAMFCSKQGEAESHQLPPCHDCLHHHCKPITRPQSGRTHLPTTKFQIRLERDGL